MNEQNIENLPNNLNNENSYPTILAKFKGSIIKDKPNTQRTLVEEMGNKLNSFTKRNQQITHINHSIYHLLLDPFTINNAYKNISKNKGSMTQGTNLQTIQGYSRLETQKIIKKLKDKNYTPAPVKRVWVPKPGKKEKRPLGIPNFNDRVVQEAMRGILEAIYEPEFRAFEQEKKICTNFGFRPTKNCWDAIQHFTTYGQKATYVIEGDIKGAYNNVSFKILMKLIERRIKDKNFLELLLKFLKAGIMEEGKYEHSIIGVPQGGILSPLLFNIYMFEFDKYIFEEIIKKNCTENPTKNKTTTYQNALYKKNKLKNKYRKLRNTSDKDNPELLNIKQQYKEASHMLMKTPSYDRSKEISMVYTRYADDWLLGISSNFHFALEIKSKIQEWLRSNLELELSEDKTKITNIRKNLVPFLGYQIILYTKNPKIIYTRTNNKQNSRFLLTIRRTTSLKYHVTPNKERLQKKITQIGIAKPGTYNPIGKRPWASLDEFQIVQKYHSMYLGLVGHYINCNSLAILNRLSYIFQYSCAKTIATRKKITTPQVFNKYGKSLTIKKYIKGKDKPIQIEFMGLKKIRELYFKDKERTLPIEFDPFKIRTFWRTTFKLYSICCICGSDTNIQMHHIKSLKTIKDKTPTFNLILKQLNRKQAPICHTCHVNITQGRYDGKSIKDLFSESLAAL